ncbi:hypothetical protein [Kurthia sibirica]|uniref:hypothetical protein n=2 Tax=Kurthia sibirica TaxID=202750 RepID=UPI0011BEB3C1|nr:hypothetical protein [Kurthia sibirica]
MGAKMRSPILLKKVLVRGESMDNKNLVKEIKQLKEQIQGAQDVEFIIIYDEKEEALYTERQLKNAHVIKIVAKED